MRSEVYFLSVYMVMVRLSDVLPMVLRAQVCAVCCAGERLGGGLRSVGKVVKV